MIGEDKVSTESLTAFTKRGTEDSARGKKSEKVLVTPASDFEPTVHEHACDVLVIGGGVAGCAAAVAAKETGAQVIVAEKYNIYSSGDAGTGEDHFLAILGTDDWDTPEEFFRTYLKGNRDIPGESRELIRKFAYELPEVTKRYEKMGMKFKDQKTGRYFRVEAFGEGHAYTVQFDGSNFKRVIASNVVDNKIPIINRLMITKIFLDENGKKVVGAAGIQTVDGSFHVFKTKSVIITTGEGCRIYRSTSGHPYDSWHSPYNTGDGIAMAFKAGAELANIEFLALTMCAKGYSTPGTHAFFGMGCYLINSKGERFMTKYHPLGERSERAFLTWGIYSEMRAGRGPCYVDARHLSKEDQERLVETLVVDKGPFGDYLRQKGIDLSKEPMEVSISEFHAQCGIRINDECETTVEGMYAAGEGTGSTAVSRVGVEGYRAGRSAAKYAQKINPTPSIPENDLNAEKSRVYAPLKRSSGIHYLDFEKEIRDIMSDYVGFERTDKSIRKAVVLLDQLSPSMKELKAENYHDLMRALESQNVYVVARLVARASLERKETRWGGNLIAPRGDFPDPVSEWGNKIIVLKKENRDETRINSEIRIVEEEDKDKQVNKVSI
ncbi:MAG: FAD-binding protein [archaeon]|nr:FAD-binding protein [archaeon]